MRQIALGPRSFGARTGPVFVGAACGGVEAPRRGGTFAHAGQFVFNGSGSDGGALTTLATGVRRWGVVTCGRRPILKFQ